MTTTTFDRYNLAMDTIRKKTTRGIPVGFVNLMEHRMIDRVAGRPEGSYARNPEETYLAMLRGFSCGMVDQYIPDNPLSMGSHGYEAETALTATTGAETVVRDGILIDSPEAVAEHLERYAIPQKLQAIRDFDEAKKARAIIDGERAIQLKIGPDMLKAPYGWIHFPGLAYGYYGYENYFMAYALYPELMERFFSLQADLSLLSNGAAVRAYAEGNLPPYHRLDHDMCDSRGPLVDIKSLEKIWFPHFARSIAPLRAAGVTMIWHCDGNVMPMIPGLLDAGIKGFQGFQYEDGVDYESICRMKARDGEDLLIWAGVSVTRTLPLGTPRDVVNELKWLVDQGPKHGLFLGCSSSVAPGVPWENLKALADGFKHYSEHGRG